MKQVKISRGQVPERFLENLLKNFPSALGDLCNKLSHRKFLLELVNPLWNKHAGKEDKICADLAAMGERIRLVEQTVDLSNQSSLAHFVMGIHGRGLPSLMPTRVELLKKAFGRHMLKRMVFAASGATAVAVFGFIGSLFKNLELRKVFNYSSNVGRTIPAFMTAFTIHTCFKALVNRDNSQARADYKVFLTRLSLQGSHYQPSFYWSWFLPMWRFSKGDILAVEKLFVERIAEVQARYVALHAPAYP